MSDNRAFVPSPKRVLSAKSLTNKVNPQDTEETMQVQDVDGTGGRVQFKNKNGESQVSVSVISDGGKKAAETAAMEEDELEKKNEAERNRPPLLYCRFIVNYPKTSFALTLGIHMLFILATAVMIQVGYDIIPFSLDRLPLDIQNDEDYLRAGAWNNRFLEDNKIYNRLKASTAVVEVESERTVVAQLVELYFEMKDGNVFTKAALQSIQDVENELFNLKDYQDKYCFLDKTGNCTKPTSILRYFDGTYAMVDPLLNDTSFDNIPRTIGTAFLDNSTKSALRYHFGANFTVDKNAGAASSTITRTRMFIAYPLAGYNGTDDRKDEQLDKISLFVNTTLYKKLEDLGELDKGGVDFFYFNSELIGVSISATAMSDILLVGAGLGFVFVFMWIQTQSLWITGFSILSIFSGFTAANMIYRVILDYRYFGTFNILALFIILGIGADDVFIFVDTFKATGHHDYPSLAHRLSACYRKASVAMLFTSLTTAIAFFISAASPLLGVSTFGLFAGLLVVVNYLTVITYIPTVVIVWHNAWDKCRWCPCCCKKSDDDDPHNPDEPIADEHHRKNPIVRFFRRPYFKFVTHKIARWIIIVFFIALGATFTYFASQLAPNEEQIEFLKPDTNFGKALNRITSGFAPSAESTNVKVFIAWGLKKHDYSSCHKTNFSCVGQTVWDDSFDLNSAEAQKGLYDFCTTMKNLSPQEIKDLEVQRNFLTNDLEVDCFIHDLDTYLKTEQDILLPTNTRKYPVGTNFSYPFEQANMMSLMQRNPILYNTSVLPGDFKRYFETGLSFWMYDGMNPQSKYEAFKKHNAMLGEQIEAGQSQDYRVGGFKFGNRLRFAAIVVNTTVNGRNLGYPQGLPLRDNWENFVSKKMKEMPAPLQGGFQLTTNTWHYMKVQQTLSTSALLGIVIGVSVAFPILVIATNNFLTGSIALLMLAMITVSVVGFIPMNGWKLGVLESLNMVLVVGLSVDYVVHLAEGYSRSPHSNRLGRTQDMLEEVGISVLSGAVTTSGAAMCMLIAQILFFAQFGLIMFITIVFSIVHALVLFPTIMALVGPQGDTGRVTALFGKCFPSCAPK